jgi:hypothetical protein
MSKKHFENKISSTRPKGSKNSALSRVRRIIVAVLGLVIALNVANFAVQTVIRSRTAHEDLGLAAADVGRDLGYGGLMALSENIYYGVLNKPTVGGTPTGGAVFGKVISSSAPTPVTISARPAIANNPAWGAASGISLPPAPVTSPVTVPLKNEGVWEPTKIVVNGQVAVRIARVRPDAIHTSFMDTLVWMDPKLLAFQEIPGTLEPAGNYPHGTGRVPLKLRKFYMLGINGGYKTVNMHGGFIYKGSTVIPMRDHMATLITYPDGSVNVADWNVDAVKSGYTSARQNLPMLVENGKSRVISNTDPQWGSLSTGTSSGANYVWRSAIGVRADGSVIHLVGPSLNAQSMADLMVRAGAVRAMALDMNNGWASSFLYGPYLPGQPVDPQITKEVTRFWNTSTRDFLAVFAKSPAGVSK